MVVIHGKQSPIFQMLQTGIQHHIISHLRINLKVGGVAGSRLASTEQLMVEILGSWFLLCQIGLLQACIILSLSISLSVQMVPLFFTLPITLHFNNHPFVHPIRQYLYHSLMIYMVSLVIPILGREWLIQQMVA